MKFIYLIAILLFVERSNAVIGVVDVDNEFPYVVQIDLGNGRCSGAVNVDNLITTAAHCVWKPETKTQVNPSDIRVSYVDMWGERKTVRVTSLFFPEQYRRLAKYWKQRDPYDSVRDTEVDIAILIPAESIELNEYASWITDVYNKYPKYDSRSAPGGLPPLQEALGSFNNVTTRVVGFGGFGCQKYTIDDDGNDDCKRDGKRRYAEAPLIPSVDHGYARAAVPKVWCGGIGSQGVNPVRRGDSGGPFFVKTLDPRWLYVGNVASIIGDYGCSSSLTSNVEWLQQVLNSTEYKNRPRHSDEWYVKRAEHAVGEFFRLLSSPSDEALPRLLAMYYGIEKDEDGKIIDVGGIDHRGAVNVENFGAKKKLIEKWPVRNFTVDSVEAEVSLLIPRRAPPGAFHRASGYFSWSLFNPATGARREGRSQFNMTLITLQLEENPLEAGGARNTSLIYEEDFTPTLGVVQDFQVSRNFSYDGGDYENFKDADLLTCQNRCRYDNQCAAFSYIERLRWCWLKSKVPPSSVKAGITSGMKLRDSDAPAPAPAPEPTPSPTLGAKQNFKRFQNFSYDGADYDNAKGIDLESCQRICAQDEKCKAYSFIEKSNWCWWKSTVPSSSVKAGITSGMKVR